jgi:hypothetical protein
MSTATYAMRRNQNLYRNQANLQLGPVSVSFVMVAMVCVLALLYLTQITKTSVYGYKVTELSKQRNQILASKQALEVEAARLQSIQKIEQSNTVAQMVPEQNVKYATARR